MWATMGVMMWEDMWTMMWEDMWAMMWEGHVGDDVGGHGRADMAAVRVRPGWLRKDREAVVSCR